MTDSCTGRSYRSRTALLTGLVAAAFVAGCGGGNEIALVQVPAATPAPAAPTSAAPAPAPAPAPTAPSAPNVTAQAGATTLSSQQLSWAPVQGATSYKVALRSTGTGTPIDLPLPLDAALGGSSVTVRTPSWLAAGDSLVTSACNQLGCTPAAQQNVGSTFGATVNVPTYASTPSADGLTLAANTSPTSPVSFYQRASVFDMWPSTAAAALAVPALLPGGFRSDFVISGDAGVLASAANTATAVLGIAVAPASAAAWHSIALPSSPTTYALSANGRRVAVQIGTSVVVYDLTGIASPTWTAPSPTVLALTGFGRVNGILLSADGRWVLVDGTTGSGQAAYSRVDLTSSTTSLAAVQFGGSAAYTWMTSSADGQTIGLTAYDSHGQSTVYPPIQCSTTACPTVSATPLQQIASTTLPWISLDGSVYAFTSPTAGGVYIRSGSTWMQASPLTAGSGLLYMDPGYGLTFVDGTTIKAY